MRRLHIEPASDMDEVRAILREYAESTGVDLAFQKFEEELAALPGFYVAIFVARPCSVGLRPTFSTPPPQGRPEAHTTREDIAGCVALRHLDAITCEMKRLYVRPQYRGRDLGRKLATAIIEEARQRGYHTMRLDTLPSMIAAMSLYESLGFVPVDPYRYNPVPGSRFLELTL